MNTYDRAVRELIEAAYGVKYRSQRLKDALGTHKDNMDEMTAKGRRTTKLKPDQVRQIRALLGTMPQNAIARQFGITNTQVSIIKLRKQWKGIEP